MIKIKKHSWSEVTLSEYDKIMTIAKDETLSDAEKDISLLSILCEVPEDEIWEMQMDDVRKLREDMLWLNKNFDYPKTLNFKKIKIGDWDCTIEPDITKMTYAQFVDFQNYSKDMDEQKFPKNKAEVLSVFFIPVGHKYGDGYDILDLQKAIRDNVSILTYNSCWFFFLRKYVKSLNNSAISLASMLRARSWLMRKKNPLREEYGKLSNLIRELPSTLG